MRSTFEDNQFMTDLGLKQEKPNNRVLSKNS